MNIDQLMQQLAALRCPRQVDVVEDVMQEVSLRPYMMKTPAARRWRTAGIAAAAAALIAVAANVVFANLQQRDDDGIGAALTQVNDYSSWNAVEELAFPEEDFLLDNNNDEE